ncbi:MAG: hypothetical protein M1546_22520, partial [Chloroflexi bacterium]|nr:hypothetical protein [Chloroflexota bacterium]
MHTLVAKHKLIAGLISAAIVLTACPAGGTPASTPALPPTATVEAMPTRTVAPTATAAPTNTIVPTGTATPTLIPTPTDIPAPTPTAGTIDLRAVDWNAFLQNDPQLDHPDMPDIGNPDLGPYVAMKPGSGIEAGGYALTANILYADLNDDGAVEAVISLFSGGTAGNIGLLIYATAPELITGLGGYKVYAQAEVGQLLVTQPLYGKWDGNCCPSGYNETRYRLEGNKLVAAGRTNQGYPEARVPTVELFYQMLNNKQYRDAYDFLSPAFQAANPFDAWSAGYQDTVSIEAQASESAAADGPVTVLLTSVAQSASGKVTQRFSGTWTLVWSNDASQWLLDEAATNLHQEMPLILISLHSHGVRVSLPLVMMPSYSCPPSTGVQPPRLKGMAPAALIHSPLYLRAMCTCEEI